MINSPRHDPLSVSLSSKYLTECFYVYTGFKDAGKRSAAADEGADRKSPAETNDRQQTDEREVDNGAAATSNDRAATENPEKQERSPAADAQRADEPKE